MGTDLRAAVRNPAPDFQGRKVDTDGARPLQRGGYKVQKSVEKESVSDESVNEIHKNGVVPRKANKSSVSVGSRLTEADFLFRKKERKIHVPVGCYTAYLLSGSSGSGETERCKEMQKNTTHRTKGEKRS